VCDLQSQEYSLLLTKALRGSYKLITILARPPGPFGAPAQRVNVVIGRFSKSDRGLTSSLFLSTIRFGINGNSSSPTHKPLSGRRAWFRHSRRRPQFLAFIVVTDRDRAAAQRILSEMRRGVTELSGTGMYSDRNHPVLVCALTVTQVEHLKTVVNAQDPRAFVVVLPAQEVLGGGFQPLGESEE
jgi:hypothetical protein